MIARLVEKVGSHVVAEQRDVDGVLFACAWANAFVRKLARAGVWTLLVFEPNRVAPVFSTELRKQ